MDCSRFWYEPSPPCRYRMKPFLSMRYFVGHVVALYAPQTRKSLSITTGYRRPNVPTAFVTSAGSRPNGKRGVWTPMTTRPSSRYRRCHSATYGALRIYACEVKSQNSSRITDPCREEIGTGSAFIQKSP